ncbi:MAG: nuclear transport factor 2 family protein [Myxococcales bacterium]
MRVLLSEDEPDLGALLTELMNAWEFEVVWVSTASEALDWLSQNGCALVIVDCVRGTRSQAEKEALALAEAAGPIPLGVLTAWTNVPRAVADRAAFMLSKPFPLEKLLSAMSVATRVQERAAERALVLQYFDALSRQDWVGVASLCGEDVQYCLPSHDPVLGATIVGRANFHAFTEKTFAAFEGARFEVSELHWLPRGVVARYRASWQTGHGERASSTGDVVFSFCGPEIARIGIRIEKERLRLLHSAAVSVE